MLAFGIGAVLFGALLAWRLLGAAGAFAMAALLALDPLMLRQSIVLQAEGPAICVALLGLALATCSVTTPRRRTADITALAAGVAIATGILTKLFAVAALPPLGVLVLLYPNAIRRGLLLSAGAVAAITLWLVPLREAWSPMLQQVVALHVASRSLPYGQLTDAGFTAVLKGELPLLGVALVGAVVGWSENRAAVLVGLAWLAGAALTISVTHPLWPRHVVLLVPGACLLAAAGAQGIARWSHRWRRGAVVVATATLMAAGLAGVLTVAATSLQPSSGVDPFVAVLQRETSTEDLVLSDDQFATAAAGRSSPPAYVDTSFVRLAASHVTVADLARVLDGEKVCAVVLATGRLAGVPGFSEWLHTHYILATDLGGGREVYLRPDCVSD